MSRTEPLSPALETGSAALLPLLMSENLHIDGMNRARGNLLIESPIDYLLALHSPLAFKYIADGNNIEVTTFALYLDLTVGQGSFQQCFYIFRIYLINSLLVLVRLRIQQTIQRSPCLDRHRTSVPR